jgi:hypothetical protein
MDGVIGGVLERTILELLPRFLEGLESSSKALGEWLEPVVSKLGFLIAEHPEVLLIFVLNVVLAAPLIGVILATHLVIRLPWSRRARVFISFQHDHDLIAKQLKAEMEKCGINPVKLPFVENPDHDMLLDQVKQEIRDCNVFVCIPGSRPSFVESEVSMAFGLEKPLLFLIEAGTSRLPNTAKKGYPIFALERVQREGLRTLVNFCSYLAADWRSTVRLYGALFNHMMLGANIYFIICLISIVPVALWVDDWAKVSREIPKLTDSGGFIAWAQAVACYPPNISFIMVSLALCLLIYIVFSMTRSFLRRKVRRAISGKKFSESFLPKTLDFSLTRADLLKILYRDDIPAEHESE